jgi:hypothetical protein
MAGGVRDIFNVHDSLISVMSIMAWMAVKEYITRFSNERQYFLFIKVRYPITLEISVRSKVVFSLFVFIDQTPPPPEAFLLSVYEE